MNPPNRLPRLLKLWPAVALLATLAAPSVSAQPAPFYINDGLVQAPPQVPPQIDAVNFVNNATFNIQGLLSTMPYATANTVNYTNRGVMASSSGFAFMTYPDFGGPVPAETFYNDGTINSGADTLWLWSFSSLAELPQTQIHARTVISPGSFNLGANTLLNVVGEQVDFQRSSLLMASDALGIDRVTTGGSYDEYWGVGTARMNPAFNFSAFFPGTPLHYVTNRYFATQTTNAGYQTAFTLTDPTIYLEQRFAPSNIYTFAAFVQERNPAVSNEVFMDFVNGAMSVRWFWQGRNPATGGPMTQEMFLFDNLFGITNRAVVTNGYVGAIPTLIPTNYYFLTFNPIFGPPALEGDPSGIFPPGFRTNDYTAYRIMFLPNTVIPDEVYGQTIERLPGRVQLTASTLLDVTRARIAADNFISLSTSNHFEGAGAALSAPFINLDLATTNGLLTLSNFLAPSLDRPMGAISMFSTVWNQTDAAGVTNHFFVLMVDSDFSPTSALEANQVRLRAPNVIISDHLNIRSNLLITATNVTITTNAPGSLTPYGSVELRDELITFPSAFPLLQNFTNHGLLSVSNVGVFAGLRAPPYSPTTYTEAYDSFANHGVILSGGAQIRAKEFVNSGVLDAGAGIIELFSGNAYLGGGQMSTLAGAVTLIATNALVISNTSLTLDRRLTLSAGTLLDDGSLGSAVANLTYRNAWTVGQGITLSRLPSVSSLLGTTLTNIAAEYEQVPNVWAGQDRGNSVLGYQNNAALGRLVLTGGTNCSFAFAGTGGNNALYVDRLELESFAGAKDSANNLSALDIAPGFRIYFAEATIDGVSQAEKINGVNDGRLVWVSSYAGFYSATNIVYPNGTTNAVNRALAMSCNLDSDGDGLVNCIDPTPIPVAGYCTLTLGSSAASFEFTGGTGGFSVTDTNFCGYSVHSSNDWIVVTSGLTGNGFSMVSYRVDTNTLSASRTGTIQVISDGGAATYTITQTAGGWVQDPIFGDVWFAGDSWFGSAAYGWMWYEPSGVWVWSSSLQGWLGIMNGSRTLWSPEFQWLTPSTDDPYLAETTTLGPIFIGQFQGTTVPDGWVGSEQFGHVWAAGDGIWFYSSVYGWLGVTAEGDIWSVDQNRWL